MSATDKAARPRIRSLDGLRGLLALLVAGYHLSGQLVGLSAAQAQWTPLLRQGWYAVDVFFVMSGFVMMHVYGATFAKALSVDSCKQFFLARIARLHPIHLAAMAVMALIVLPFNYAGPEFLSPSGRYSWWAALLSVFMLHGPWIDHRTWNYPAWSISAEWHAYVLFPLLALVLAPLKRWIHGLICTIGVLVPLALYLHQAGAEPYPTNGPAVLLRVLPLFAAGMAVYSLHGLGWFRQTWLALPTVLMVLVMLSVKALEPLAVLLAPALVLTVLENDGVKRFFEHRWLTKLGDISFSLYMTHAIVEILVVYGGIRYMGKVHGVDLASDVVLGGVLWLVSLVVALMVGWGAWRWVEVPARVHLMARWSRPA